MRFVWLMRFLRLVRVVWLVRQRWLQQLQRRGSSSNGTDAEWSSGPGPERIEMRVVVTKL